MPSITASTFVSNFKSVFGGGGGASGKNSNKNSPAGQINSPKQQKLYIAKKLIAENLLQELEFQIREAENYNKEMEKQKNNESGRPDYTWLMDTPKAYRLPPAARSELEELSKHLDTSDVSQIIKEFRDAIDYDVAPDKMANYLKFIMNHHIYEKRKDRNCAEYKRLQLTPTNPVPIRSQSSAIIQQQIRLIRGGEGTNGRPSSAPLSNSWKKRSRVHPAIRSNDIEMTTFQQKPTTSTIGNTVWVDLSEYSDEQHESDNDNDKTDNDNNSYNSNNDSYNNNNDNDTYNNNNDDDNNDNSNNDAYNNNNTTIDDDDYFENISHTTETAAQSETYDTEFMSSFI